MSNLIYGFHSVTNYVKNNPGSIEQIYFDIKRKDKRQQELITLTVKHDIKTSMLSDSELNNLTGTTTHQGVAAKVKPLVKLTLNQILESLKNKTAAQILILDGITDPQNLGAIIRSAECFGVDAIILPKDNSANTDNAVVAKASSGAINNLPIITVNNISQAMETLKEHEFWIAGTCLSPNSINLFDFKFSGKLAWVMGNEGSGIRRLVQENCDYLIKIPLQGNTQSLNVSVATGIVLAYANYMQDK